MHTVGFLILQKCTQHWTPLPFMGVHVCKMVSKWYGNIYLTKSSSPSSSPHSPLPLPISVLMDISQLNWLNSCRLRDRLSLSAGQSLNISSRIFCPCAVVMMMTFVLFEFCDGYCQLVVGYLLTLLFLWVYWKNANCVWIDTGGFCRLLVVGGIIICLLLDVVRCQCRCFCVSECI